MKLRIAAVLILGLVLAPLAYAGNGAPSGAHYNLNIIGVPKGMNDNFSGGEGSRIFVLRTGTTWFYVGASDHYEVMDHDGTDGVIGTAGNPGSPGIVFPYADGEWKAQIYVRLLGPQTSQVKWRTYVFDGVSYVTDPAWAFTLNKDTKFQLKTGQLLIDGFENILWEMYDKTDFRLLQMRIYLEPL